MDDRVQILTVAPVVGDGTKRNPRRPTYFWRLDVLLKMVRDLPGIMCFQADGTSVDRTEMARLKSAMVRDFGHSCIVQQSMDRDFWEASRPYVTSLTGFDLWGETLPELRDRAKAGRAFLLDNLEGRLPLDRSEPLGPQVRAALQAANPSGPALAVRDFYLARMAGDPLELPSALYNPTTKGLRPAAVAAALAAFDAAPPRSVMSWSHEAYDAALLDAALRRF